MKSVKDIKAELEKDRNVKVAAVDVDGILRGKIISKDKFLSVIGDGFGFCGVLYSWDMLDTPYELDSSISFSNGGYRDLQAMVDIEAFYRIPWENNIPFFLLKINNPDTHQPMPQCPRSMLGQICDKYEQSLNGIPMAGSELEFYHYKESAESVAEKGGINLKPLTPGMFGYSIQRPTLNQDYFYDILETCSSTGVTLEGWHTETGPGVYEAALAYGSVRDIADKTALFKLICKSLGPRYGVLPCFMAKPQQGMPGNSGHMHLSVLDKKTGQNLFARDEPDPSPQWSDIKYLSDFGRHFLAGILEGLPDIMPLLAPTINSYKRLNENFFAPVTVSWGLEHRIASIRLISPPVSSKKGTRLEIRTPGADVHTHYAFAALLALGYRGVQNKTPLTVPPMGDEESSKFAKLPKSLSEATDKFSAPNSLAREVLGDAFVDHYAGTRYHEVKEWNDAVTNWEVTRYIETV